MFTLDLDHHFVSCVYEKKDQVYRTMETTFRSKSFYIMYVEVNHVYHNTNYIKRNSEDIVEIDE